MRCRWWVERPSLPPLFHQPCALSPQRACARLTLGVSSTTSFIDHELAPLRKTTAARLEDEAAEKAGMRSDLLLVGVDGVPIVGEVKVATAASHDTDPVLALVQGLTVCAQLLSPQQTERLENAVAERHGIAPGFVLRGQERRRLGAPSLWRQAERGRSSSHETPRRSTPIGPPECPRRLPDSARRERTRPEARGTPSRSGSPSGPCRPPGSR